MNARLSFFTERGEQNRMWWFKRNGYLPQIYASLPDDDFEILKQWYDASAEKKWMGECNIPLMSVLLGFIDGHDLDSGVQLGHFAGWSTIMIGWALRRTRKKNALWSVDTNEAVTTFTNQWLKRADLEDVCVAEVGNSTDRRSVNKAMAYLQKPIKFVFIDSSHAYQQTLDELDIWYEVLASGGVIFLHDVGKFAQQYDGTNMGGVHDAFLHWTANNTPSTQNNMMINKDMSHPIVMQDACGLGIIQKSP